MKLRQNKEACNDQRMHKLDRDLGHKLDQTNQTWGWKIIEGGVTKLDHELGHKQGHNWIKQIK